MPDITPPEDADALLTPDLTDIPEDDSAEPLDAEPEHIDVPLGEGEGEA